MFICLFVCLFVYLFVYNSLIFQGFFKVFLVFVVFNINADLGWILVPTWLHFGAVWAPKTRLGSVLGHPGGMLGRLERVLGASWGVLEASWARLGVSWRRLGASWERLGASWKHLGSPNLPKYGF